jgi:hypothetical protein
MRIVVLVDVSATGEPEKALNMEYLGYLSAPLARQAHPVSCPRPVAHTAVGRFSLIFLSLPADAQ